MPLEFETQRWLTIAEGYAELGMYEDADAELANIPASMSGRPEVLALRVAIYGALQRWASMQEVSRKLALSEPDNPQWAVSWAYATRRADSLEAARTILLCAAEGHPGEAIFHFNLACYECQLGNFDAAHARLQKAFKINAHWRRAALKDQDLEPLWESLRD